MQLVQVLKKIFLKIFQIAEKRKENYKKEDWQRTPTLPAICFLLYLFTPSPAGEMYKIYFRLKESDKTYEVSSVFY